MVSVWQSGYNIINLAIVSSAMQLKMVKLYADGREYNS